MIMLKVDPADLLHLLGYVQTLKYIWYRVNREQIQDMKCWEEEASGSGYLICAIIEL